MKTPCLCLEKPHQAQQRGISTEPLGCGQVSGPPNYSDEDEKDRSKRYGQAGRREVHGPQGGLLLAASREVSGPTFKFSSTPARPGRPAAQARQDQGRRRTELAWTGFIFSQLPAAHLFVVYKLPSRQRQEFHLSFPSFSLLLSISTPFIKELQHL